MTTTSKQTTRTGTTILASLVAMGAVASWAQELTVVPLSAPLSPDRVVHWHQDVPGMLDSAEAGDEFGNALAVGDFDCDDIDDLAVAAFREDTFNSLTQQEVSRAGQVAILFGSDGGLDTADNHVLVLPFGGEQEGQLGESLAAGDFDGDDCDDLAVGAPRYDNPLNAGAVFVAYGEADRVFILSQTWRQIVFETFAAFPQVEDRFGTALAAGDFDGDDYDDLAISIVPSVAGNDESGGAVQVLYGGFQGLTGQGAQLWHQDSPGIVHVREDEDDFGAALAAGDFDCDTYDDLAIGVPGQSVNGKEGAGAVNVIYGGPSGLQQTNDQFFHQDVMPGATAEPLDRFGSVLAAGDYFVDGGGCEDLAVGVPREGIGAPLLAGAVHLLPGGGGLDFTVAQLLLQSQAPGGEDAAGSLFGSALVMADLDDDPEEELVVGIPGKDDNLGGVAVFGHTDTPLLLPRSELTTLPTMMLPTVLGEALAAGRFDGRGTADLAIASPLQPISGMMFAGMVSVVPSAGLFADGFESGDTSAWTP